jgi:hypothetical protein
LRSAEPELLAAVAFVASLGAARVALLRFDAAALTEALLEGRRVLELLPDSERAWAAQLLEVQEAWRDLCAGKRLSGEVLDGLRLRSAAAGLRVCVIEVTLVRGLAALVVGDTQGALLHVERAVRMAQAEEMPLVEDWALLWLSRVHRAAGRIHRAVGISSSLRRQCPTAWQAWVEWEWLLAGAPSTEAPRSEAPRSGVASASAASSVAFCADAGFEAACPEVEQLAGLLENPASAAAFRELLDRLAPFLLQRQDVQGMALAAGHELSGACAEPWLESHVTAFRRGERAELPLGLLSASLAGRPTAEALAYVVVEPGSAPYRIPTFALSCPPPPRSVASHVRREQPRLESSAAALVAAGEDGIVEREFFASVYGFAYKKKVHGGSLRVLVHRLREHLAPFGQVVRADGRIRFVPETLTILPDPRCSVGRADRLLSLLACRGAATAQETARALGVPLRSVQNLLQTLVDDGACVPRRSGRTVHYRLENAGA